MPRPAWERMRSVLPLRGTAFGRHGQHSHVGSALWHADTPLAISLPSKQRLAAPPGSARLDHSRSHCSQSRGTRAPLLVLITIASFLPSAGCRSGGGERRWFERKPGGEELAARALEGRTADERRRNVIDLAESKDAQADWAVKTFDSIARTDVDATVRCAAIGGLSKSADQRSVTSLIKITEAIDGDGPDVKRAAPVVRWDAIRLLARIVDRHTYEELQRPDIVRCLIERAKSDVDRNVRLTAIDTLAYFAEQPIPSCLVECLDSDDFAIRNAAEKSLIALTGATHQHDADAWRTWLASHPDPFAEAGKSPPELQNRKTAERSWWPW